MAEEKRFAKATWAIMEQLLEVDNLEDALAASLPPGKLSAYLMPPPV